MALGDVGGNLSLSCEMCRKEQQMHIQPNWALSQTLSTLPLPILVFPGALTTVFTLLHSKIIVSLEEIMILC